MNKLTKFTQNCVFPNNGTEVKKGDKVRLTKLNGDTFINYVDRVNAQSIIVGGVKIQALKTFKIEIL